MAIVAGFEIQFVELTRNFRKSLLKKGSKIILGRMFDGIDAILEMENILF